MQKWRDIVIAGPTGAGKTALAEKIALAVGGEIVSFDSVQVFRGFDVGSAKAKDLSVPQHMVDIVDWHEPFDAAEFAGRARLCVDKLRGCGKVPILVGGTGLYLRAYWGEKFAESLPSDPAYRASLAEVPRHDLWQCLVEADPTRAKQIHPNDRVRIERALELIHAIGGPISDHIGFNGVQSSGRPHSFVILLDPPRPVLHQRIARRTDELLAAGLVDEVRHLLEAGVDADAKPMRSIGYAQVVKALAHDKMPGPSQLADPIVFATRQYAKRQCTWFRKVDANLHLQGADAENFADLEPFFAGVEW